MGERQLHGLVSGKQVQMHHQNKTSKLNQSICFIVYHRLHCELYYKFKFNIEMLDNFALNTSSNTIRVCFVP